LTDTLGAILVLVGGFFLFVGSFGVVRLPDVYCRMHAATKATTLGLVGILLATFLVLPNQQIGFRAILAIAFAFLTAPVGAHMIARAAYRYPVRMTKETCCDELKGEYKEKDLGEPCPDRDPEEPLAEERVPAGGSGSE
jgi:multicomponent Na+:H+ antiporter subunit G